MCRGRSPVGHTGARTRQPRVPLQIRVSSSAGAPAELLPEPPSSSGQHRPAGGASREREPPRPLHHSSTSSPEPSPERCVTTVARVRVLRRSTVFVVPSCTTPPHSATAALHGCEHRARRPLHLPHACASMKVNVHHRASDPPHACTCMKINVHHRAGMREIPGLPEGMLHIGATATHSHRQTDRMQPISTTATRAASTTAA